MKTEKQFIKEFKNEMGIDYRKHVFLENQYGDTPTFDYDFAKKIVIELNKSLIDLFEHQLVIYDLSMDVEYLRTQTLSNYIETRVFDYYK